MQRPIPGTQEVEGREFMYIESTERETFDRLLDSVFINCPSIAMPRSGGVVEEKVRVNLKNGILLIGISYRGDIEEWRAKFAEFCEKSGRTFGFIKEGRLFLSGGFSSLIEELEIDFD